MFSGTFPETGIGFLRFSLLFVFIPSKKKLKNNNIHRFFKKLFSHFTLLMGNGAIGNGAKAREFFEDFVQKLRMD
jgi:hypothetical protein